MTELTEVPYLSAKQVTQLKKNNINTVVDLLYSFLIIILQLFDFNIIQ